MKNGDYLAVELMKAEWTQRAFFRAGLFLKLVAGLMGFVSVFGWADAAQELKVVLALFTLSFFALGLLCLLMVGFFGKLEKRLEMMIKSEKTGVTE